MQTNTLGSGNFENEANTGMEYMLLYKSVGFPNPAIYANMHLKISLTIIAMPSNCQAVPNGLICFARRLFQSLSSLLFFNPKHKRPLFLFLITNPSL
jgi:hypothetical protein